MVSPSANQTWARFRRRVCLLLGKGARRYEFLFASENLASVTKGKTLTFNFLPKKSSGTVAEKIVTHSEEVDAQFICIGPLSKQLNAQLDVTLDTQSFNYFSAQHRTMCNHVSTTCVGSFFLGLRLITELVFSIVVLPSL